VNFRDEDDELIGAELVSSDDDLLLVSRKGQSVRFRADDAQLRPMGRATSGVTGMKFRAGDELLSMSVIPAKETAAGSQDAVLREQQYVFTVTDGGWAKRTRVEEYRRQGRGGLGIKAMKLQDARGSLVGGLVVTEDDEVMSIKASGQVTRSGASDVPVKGRDTMGVKFVDAQNGDQVVAIARSGEREDLVDGFVEADEASNEGAETAQVEARGGAETDGKES
jgi:DNA gyrase subunit A